MIKDFYNIFKSVQTSNTVRNIRLMGYGDPYNILSRDNVDYSAAILELKGITLKKATARFSFRLTIVDKLTEDGSNLGDVYETSLRQAQDIFIYFQSYGFLLDEGYSVHYISQQFADYLGGVYIEFTITRQNYLCHRLTYTPGHVANIVGLRHVEKTPTPHDFELEENKHNPSGFATENHTLIVGDDMYNTFF